MSQLVDDALNSAMEAETKIADAIEISRKEIDATSDFRGLFPSNLPVLHQQSDAPAVTEEMTTASTNGGSWDLALADALKRSLYPKVGLVSLLYLS